MRWPSTLGDTTAWGADVPALLDRDGFIAAIDRLLDDAAAGEGRLLFLGGEAGIGKTALVEHVSLGARRRARVLLGACDPLSTPRPPAPLDDIAQPLGGAEGGAGGVDCPSAPAASPAARDQRPAPTRPT